jgi:hypothetical protein
MSRTPEVQGVKLIQLFQRGAKVFAAASSSDKVIAAKKIFSVNFRQFHIMSAGVTASHAAEGDG